MINQTIKWSINNRFLVIITSLLILIAGAYVVKKTPIDAIPDLSDTQVIIKTSFPGQAPQVVEDQITYPLTTAMLSVPGATSVRAFSFFGDSYVYVIFKDNTDPYWARSRVLEYLNQVSGKFPQGIKPELGPDATGVGWIYQYALIDKSGKHDLSKLTSMQNWFLKFELQTVPGVAEVATVGGMVKQYQITLEPNKLRAYNLSLQQIKNAIQNANREAGGSVIEMAEAEYMVRTNGYLHNIKSIKDIPLGLSSKGTPIFLKNIAKIQTGPQMRRGVAELNGQGETVGGIIVMRQGENALETIEGVKEKLAQLQETLPDNVEIIETYNRSSLITNAVNNLNNKLIEEFIVVLVVCLVFLFHIRSSIIILCSLPLGILSAFIIMYGQGINANIMSLGGIAIAIGAMVDATIVMIENVHKHAEKNPITNENRWDIIYQATTEVGKPLFYSLIIITLSFLPVFTLQAQEGKLFSPLAYTKTYAMAAAAGISITLVPVLMGYFIRGKIIQENKNPINRALIALYKPVLTQTLKYPKTILVAAVIIFLSSLWPLYNLGSEFMPTMDEGDWMYMPTTLPGISIGKARQILQQTNKLIKSVPEVESVFGKIGRANTATDPAPLTMIETVIQLKPKSQWRSEMTSEKLKDELNKAVQIPGITNAWVMPIRTRIDMLATGIKTPVGIKIAGPSLKEIQAIGSKVQHLLKDLPGTSSVYAERSAGGRYINIDIDRQQAARYGLNITDIQEVIKTSVGGMNISETIEGLERYPINIRYPQSDRDSLQKLKMLPIIATTGAHIPLEDIAKVSIVGGPPVIKSENARPTGLVLIDIDTDVGSYIEKAKEILISELKLKPGYTLTWSGQYEYMQRAKNRLAMVVPFTLMIIVLLLYLSFNNIIEVFIILGTLPLALVGGLWLLYWQNYNLSVAVGIGFIALLGVAIEIGVIMLIYLRQSIQNQQKQIKKAVMDGALLRVRPITMTVSAIIAGLLPIMFGSGAGSEVMRRIASPMVGGMVSATLLSLLVLPAIYYLWKK